MYKKTKDMFGNDHNSVLRINADGTITSIPNDPANTDYQKYLEWLAEGNEPLPPDEETN